MKKLFLILILFTAIPIFAQKFAQTDTVKTTLKATEFTRVTLGSIGVKAVHVHNTSSDTLFIGFSTTSDLPDTTNVYALLSGNRINFYDRTCKYMYLFNGGADVILTTISYGSGTDYLIEPLSTTGTINTTVSNTSFNVSDTTDFSVFRKSNRDSVGSSPDTLSRLPGNFFLTAVVDTADNMAELGITKWYSLIIAPADTIVLSTAVGFNNGEYWIIYPNESWTSEKFNKFYTGNYYWKSLFTGGHTGTALVRWRYWGF